MPQIFDWVYPEKRLCHPRNALFGHRGCLATACNKTNGLCFSTIRHCWTRKSIILYLILIIVCFYTIRPVIEIPILYCGQYTEYKCKYRKFYRHNGCYLLEDSCCDFLWWQLWWSLVEPDSCKWRCPVQTFQSLEGL